MNATFSCPGGVTQSVPAGTGWRLLAGFRRELYRCLTRRRDALFALGDAVLCEDRKVTDLARLSLVPEFGRGHGALYDGLNEGRLDVARLRTAVAGLPLPRWPDGRIRLAADLSHWLRPEAVTSPGRLNCHVHSGGSGGRTQPGWTYSLVAALGPGASSWALPLDAVRLRPDDDDTQAAAAQLRETVTRLITAGHWKPGDPGILIAADAGYNATRLAWLLEGLPVLLAVRVRSDRVFRAPPPPPPPGAAGGRPQRHGPALKCADPQTWPAPAVEQEGTQARYGTALVRAWNRMHQRLERRCCGWEDWPGTDFPVIEGTLIRLSCPGPPAPDPIWIWASAPAAGPDLVRAVWTCYLRRFDIEHLFRFLKSRLGWTRPLLRDPAAADRWTWLLLACCAQLRLARGLTLLARLPWQPRTPPAAMTPGQVRAGFRRAREILGTPASPAKPPAPGPGRPKGTPNKHKAPRYPVGKTTTTASRRAERARNGAKKTG